MFVSYVANKLTLGFSAGGHLEISRAAAGAFWVYRDPAELHR